MSFKIPETIKKCPFFPGCNNYPDGACHSAEEWGDCTEINHLQQISEHDALTRLRKNLDTALKRHHNFNVGITRNLIRMVTNREVVCVLDSKNDELRFFSGNKEAVLAKLPKKQTYLK